jgi:hypothetical protein
MMKRGDCKELLLAADAARAQSEPDLAGDLAHTCPPDKLAALADSVSPAQGLLWCGRAVAAGAKGCDGPRLADLMAHLSPHLTLGPPDDQTPPDPQLMAALDQIGPELNFSWDASAPEVIVGKLSVTLDHVETPAVAVVLDPKGQKQRVPATQHRFVARAEAQVSLGDKTRTLHATEEARDSTWEAAPKLAVAAKFQPTVPPADDLKKRAVLSFLRTLSRALAAEPPEGVSVSDDKGCVAYGLSLNLTSGNPKAAAMGQGDPAKVAACEALLGEPAGAGIPVP